MSYLVYPGATHKRFEHSLGVMELATRIFDVLIRDENRHAATRDLFPPPTQLEYWRRVLRMAALCHDIGHLPFSHAAEGLLPVGWDHERISVEIVKSNDMQRIWDSVIPPLKAEHVAKIAVGQKKMKDVAFSVWENILSEIIVSDYFGADRMDYLLRDAYHTGVAYGKFDHYRLIDTLRILPKTSDDSSEPEIGVEEGGLQSAEALILARYFMYKQVYFHPVRRIFDVHLQDFLKAYLPHGQFPVVLSEFLALSDAEMLAAMHSCKSGGREPICELAKRLVDRQHFKREYEVPQADLDRNLRALELLKASCEAEFGVDNIRSDKYRPKKMLPDFPVWGSNGDIVRSGYASDVFAHIPSFSVNSIFCSRQLRGQVRKWIDANRDKVLFSRS